MDFLRIPKDEILHQDRLPSERKGIFGVAYTLAVDQTQNILAIILSPGKEYEFFVTAPSKYTDGLGVA